MRLDKEHQAAENRAEMGSLLRTVKKCKKSRRLSEVEVIEREEYGELEVDSKVEMIGALVPLGLMHVHELLDDEVRALAGERYARKEELERGRRHAEATLVQLGLRARGCRIRVPRVRSVEGGESPVRSYEHAESWGRDE